MNFKIKLGQQQIIKSNIGVVANDLPSSSLLLLLYNIFIIVIILLCRNAHMSAMHLQIVTYLITNHRSMKPSKLSIATDLCEARTRILHATRQALRQSSANLDTF